MKTGVCRLGKYSLVALQNQRLCLYNNLLDLDEEINNQFGSNHLEKQASLSMAKEVIL
jgi:hypothetical protein